MFVLSSPPSFNKVRVEQSLVFSVLHCGPLFVTSFFFIRSLYFLSFDLLPLVSFSIFFISLCSN